MFSRKDAKAKEEQSNEELMKTVQKNSSLRLCGKLS
jgi:hypothetical protein